MVVVKNKKGRGAFNNIFVKTVRCRDCKFEVTDTNAGISWKMFSSFLFRQGWRFFKRGDETAWTRLCPKCAKISQKKWSDGLLKSKKAHAVYGKHTNLKPKTH